VIVFCETNKDFMSFVFIYFFFLNIKVNHAATTVVTNSLFPNQCVGQNTIIRSTNQQYLVAFQGDGNLVLYPTTGYLWAAFAMTSAKWCMLADGNLVSYDNRSTMVWSTGTSGNPGAYAQV
jgi:hypothetical protein